MSIFISALALAITGGTLWIDNVTARLQNRKYVWLRVFAISCWAVAFIFAVVGVLILNKIIS